MNIAITPQLIYNVYNTDVLKVYLDAGVSFNISKYSNNKYTSSGGNQTTVNNYYSLESGWVGFPFKAGVLLNKRLEIFAMYMPQAAYTKYVSFSISTGTTGLGVHYCFDKSGKK